MHANPERRPTRGFPGDSVLDRRVRILEPNGMDVLGTNEYQAMLYNSEKRAEFLFSRASSAELSPSERKDLMDNYMYELRRQSWCEDKLKELDAYHSQVPQPVLNNLYYQEAPLEATLEEVDDRGNPIRQSQAQAGQGPAFASPPDPQPNSYMHAQQRQGQQPPSDEQNRQLAPVAPPQLGMNGPVIPIFPSQLSPYVYQYGYCPVVVVCPPPPLQYNYYNSQRF